MIVASATACDWLNLPEKSSPAKTKTFLIHSFGRPVLIAARSGERRGTTGSCSGCVGSAGTVGCSEVIVSIVRDRLGQATLGCANRECESRKGSDRAAASTSCRVDQHAWVQHACRVELGLGGAEGGGEGGRALAVVPGAVVAADGVVVGDRAAGVDQRLGDGGLDLVPLLDLAAADRRGEDGEVGGGAVGIDVGEAAADAGRAGAVGRDAARPRRRRGGSSPSPSRGTPRSGPR